MGQLGSPMLNGMTMSLRVLVVARMALVPLEKAGMEKTQRTEGMLSRRMAGLGRLQASKPFMDIGAAFPNRPKRSPRHHVISDLAIARSFLR